MDLKRFKGAMSSLPQGTIRSFRVSVAFFHPDNNEFEQLRDAILEVDPKLMELVKALDLEKTMMSIYIGDPDEYLESFLEDIEGDLEAMGLSYSGFFVINRAAKLGHDDSLPQTPEEWEQKTPVLEMNPPMKALFDHLKEHYCVPMEMPVH